MDEPKPDSAETRRLLRQVQAGDVRAFDQLFARHRSEVRQFTKQIVPASLEGQWTLLGQILW